MTTMGTINGKKSLAERFTPKHIILQGIKTRLAGTGINKMVLVFNVNTDKYNILLSKDDGKNMKLDIEEGDINMIKKVFISKIYNKYKSMSDIEIKAIIIEINLTLDDIRVFTQDLKDNVELFDTHI